MTGYLLKQRWAGRKRFPLVLMLEPSHACNLRCAGCGRVREYADTMGQRMSVAECLAAVEECGAPVVSVCGGEPLIYPGIKELLEKLVARRKHVYLCTNGLGLEEKLPGLRPSSRMMINVHLDGMESTHDRAAGRPGVFEQAVAGIAAAKRAGFLVFTNTTVYRETAVGEIALLLEYLTELGVDGLMLSPAYGYDAVRHGGGQGDGLFMTRAEVHAKFRAARTALGGQKARRLADLPRLPLRSAGPRLCRLGQPDAERPRLEGPLLSDHRPPLRHLSGTGRVHRLGAAGRRQGIPAASTAWYTVATSPPPCSPPIAGCGTCWRWPFGR